MARVVEGVVGRDALALGSVAVRGDWRKGWGRCIEGGICEAEGVGRSAVAAMGIRRGVGDGKALVGSVRVRREGGELWQRGCEEKVCELDYRRCWRGVVKGWRNGWKGL